MSINWQSDAEPRAQILVLPPAAASLDEAHAAIEQWEFYSRKTLDPPQRLAVEVMMAETSDGRWAARTTGREMPRQNGKGEEFEVVEFWGLTQRGEAILHTAHELNTVSSAHQRMVGLFAHRDFSGRRKPKVLNGLGQQSIATADGAVVQYRTRTAGGGRGLDDISRLIVDEAQHAKPEQLASATPTLLANPNPQMNFAGTGGIADTSDWWWSLRIRALSGDPGDFGYVGHTAERVRLDDGEVVQDPLDPLDRELWRLANPALVYGRAEEEFLEEQLRVLGPALFAREHLGVWDPPPRDEKAPTWQIVTQGAWKACERQTKVGKLHYALDVDTDTKGREWASVSVSDGTHIGVVDFSDPKPGADWVAREVASRISEVVIPPGPASRLVDDLEHRGVTVRRLTADEFARACMGLAAGVDNGAVAHLNQPRLNRAMEVAARKDSGDGVWRLSRSLSEGDISPAVAAACARFAAREFQPDGELVPVPSFTNLADYLEEED